jgi:hypothetical protein
VLHLTRDRGVRDYQRGEEARGRKIPYAKAAKETRATGDTEDALVKLCCGRSDCPWCWRKRITKTYRRALHCLLYLGADSNRPRVGFLHIGETDPPRWESLDRTIRRKHGGDTGRIRVRKADCRILVVAEVPFPGSRPVTPAEALAVVSEAIDRLHTGKHAYRMLGRWNDSKAPQWQLLGQIKQAIDFEDVYRELLAAGRKAEEIRRFNRPEFSGLIWTGGGFTAPKCPTIANGENAIPHRRNSDTGDAETWDEGIIPGDGEDGTDNPWV